MPHKIFAIFSVSFLFVSAQRFHLPPPPLLSQTQCETSLQRWFANFVFENTWGKETGRTWELKPIVTSLTVATVFNFSSGNNISIKPILMGHKLWERHIKRNGRQHKGKRELRSFFPAWGTLWTVYSVKTGEESRNRWPLFREMEQELWKYPLPQDSYSIWWNSCYYWHCTFRKQFLRCFY